jgi:hypothetical protein
VNYLGQLAQVAQQGGVGFYTDRNKGSYTSMMDVSGTGADERRNE